MKELLLNNWKPKIASLLLAMAIWYLIKSHVERVPKGRNKPVPGRNAGSASLDRPAGVLIAANNLWQKAAEPAKQESNQLSVFSNQLRRARTSKED